MFVFICSSYCLHWCGCQYRDEALIAILNVFFTLTHFGLLFSSSITWLDFFLALHSSTPFLPPLLSQHCSLSPRQAVIATYSSSGTYRTLYIRSWVISQCHRVVFFPCFLRCTTSWKCKCHNTERYTHTLPLAYTLSHWCTVHSLEMWHRCEIPSNTDPHSSTRNISITPDIVNTSV